MESRLVREKIASGVHFSALKTDKFKTERIFINIFSKLHRETAAKNAVALSVLRKRSADYDSLYKLNRRLASLYDADLFTTIRKLSDYQVLTIAYSGIDDRYTLENESVLKEGAELLKSLLLNPKTENGQFDAGDVEIEKNALIEQIESEQSEKRSYVLKRLNEIMFKDSEFGLSRLGEIVDVEGITAKNCYEAYEDFIKNSAVEIIYLGNSESDEIKEIFAKAFGSFERADAPIVKNAPSHIIRDCELTEHIEVSQSKLALGFKLPGDIIENQAAAMTVATVMYGGKPVSLLFKNVREKLSLCYYCAARYDNSKNAVVVDSGIEKENRDKTQSEVLKLLEQIKSGDFTNDDIKSTVMFLETNYKASNDSLVSLENWYLSRIAEGDIITPEEQYDRVSKVTKDDIVKVYSNLEFDSAYFLTSKEES